MKILITGGAGFIGFNFVRYWLQRHPQDALWVLDRCTYAGAANAAALESLPLHFVRGDIRDAARVADLFEAAGPLDALIHFAAESHVDRSIVDAEAFISTNVSGTWTLLEAVRKYGVGRFLHVSTDEVYGSLATGSAAENTPLRPASPYAASKAAADLMVLAHRQTYGTPLVITRSTNNFGPYQYPEKLIPLFVTNAMADAPLPLYGDGLQMRDWLYVEDNCAGLEAVLRGGEDGGVYNLGAGNEHTNREVTAAILRLLGKPETLIRPVADRAAHDRRYSVDVARARALGWAPRRDFTAGLEATVRWYAENAAWWRPIKEKSADFQNFYAAYYGGRLADGER